MNKETLTALLGALLAGTLSAENLTREQLDKLLNALAEKPAPEAKRMPMAMCYRMAAPPERVEYVCPQCGEKTIYSRDAKATAESLAAAWQAIREDQTLSLLDKQAKIRDLEVGASGWSAMRTLNYNRAQLKKLKKLGADASLDERALCGACKTTAGFPDERFVLYLNIQLDGKTATTLLQENDWVKLFAFLEGKDEWVADSSSSTAPLKPELPRIRALLGIEEKPTELEGERPREPQP